jgi:hypothetical protein
MNLDRGTKIYATILSGLILVGMLSWLLTLDSRLGEIDETLYQDPAIAAYPYRFRALEIRGTTAIISTPRSTSMPAVKFLALIKPGLANKSEQDPMVIDAQKELAALQGRVRKLVLERDDIDAVSWKLDKEWYAEKGILVE